nr:zinc finger, CCHC-type [Tanacetum cinerariifolium]
FYVIEPNDFISVNSVIESRDAIFDENRFYSIPRPKDIISSSNGTQGGDLPGETPVEIPEPRRSNRARVAKSYGYDFQLYLVEGSRDEIASQYSYCYSIEEDPKTFDEAMKSRDIFKKKMKVDGTIDKFKARLVIQGFRQKEGIDYFDTYASVSRISTIRLLIALAATHNLVIHQMDVKKTFLNGDLEEEIYMKQPEGFVMPEHKVCKLIKSLYGLKQAHKQWHHKFDEVVLSNGIVLNQSDKCVYYKFDESGKGVIICLYFDDMLIFGTDQNQVDKTKEFLSSKFSMKDMGGGGHYIEKILKKFNCEGCGPVSTPMKAGIKLIPYMGKPVNQLEYSWAIGCLMYAMTSTRPDIAYAVRKLSRFTSNPSYSDASWITNSEDHTSTTGWVFLLGGCAISWASNKQTCITDSMMESEFIALAATGKEARWLRNLIYEIPLWPKPISPISMHCDSAATLAKAYSQIYNEKYRYLGVKHSMRIYQDNLIITHSQTHRISNIVSPVNSTPLLKKDSNSWYVLEGVTLGHYERLPVGLRQVGGGGKGVVVMDEAYFGHRSFAQEMWRWSGEVGFKCFDREVEKGYVRRDLRPKDRSFR